MIRRLVTAPPSSAGVLLLMAAAMVFAPRVVPASPVAGASILLHVQPAVAKNGCGAANISNCSSVVTSGDLASPNTGPYYFVYLLASREFSSIPNISGIRCGITYQNDQPGDMTDLHGVDVYSWHLCAPLEFRSPGPNEWPRPGGGNLLVWNSGTECQTGSMVVGGYFYMGSYDADIMGVTRHPGAGFAGIADCSNREWDITTSHLGYAAFSAGLTDHGCNGCYGACPSLPLPPPATGPTALSLHLVNPPIPPPRCSALGSISCSTLTVTGSSSPAGQHYYAYLIASIGGLRGLGGVLFGLDYEGGEPGGATNGQGIDILSWGDCRGGQSGPPYTTPDWPNPGSGMRNVWAGETLCYDPDPTIVVAYFYLSAYSADVLRIAPYPGDPTATLQDCLYRPTPVAPEKLGYVGLSPDGSRIGCRPCTEDCDGPTPVVQTTWGSIKNLFGRE